MSSDASHVVPNSSAGAAGPEPTHVQAEPTFGERIAGEAKKIRGQMMGDEELKNKGQGLMDGTDAPSTRKKIEEQTGKTADQLNVETK